ncbi:Zinc finger MYM-type protein 1-like [Oopsacas minuta]|uniref:Zinc finger MYM-type protein 1-like n=1 Tax=Oopsacas minuta TaxID=111878 RepID=A0AAV7JIB7_9METZ|nr:Zinc finger MYM-type protein 1-like [Oopsacas minuta]
MESEEVFLGFHITIRTNADTLLHLVKTSLLAFGLPFSGIRGQDMTEQQMLADYIIGCRLNCRLKIQKHCTLYCLGHQLNLCVQDSLGMIPEVSIGLERMNSVVHFIKNSPKKLNRFNNIVKDLEMDDNPHLDNIVLRPLCPTRWVMRLPTVDAFLAHYTSILEFMDELKNDRTEPAKNKEWAEGYPRSLETFQNYFCLRIVQAVLWKVTQSMCNARAGMLQQEKSETGLVLWPYLFRLK